MRTFWLAGAVLALSACHSGANGGGGNDANAAYTDNMTADQNMSGADQNSMLLNDVNAAAANGSINASTQKAMQKDATTHDHDTNLANGI